MDTHQIKTTIEHIEAETQAECAVYYVDRTVELQGAYWMCVGWWLVIGVLLKAALGFEFFSELTWDLLLILGALAGSCVVYFPLIGRAFFSDAKKEYLVRQKAFSLAGERGIFSLPERNAILIFMSYFEKKAIILPDLKFKELSKEFLEKSSQKIEAALSGGIFESSKEKNLTPVLKIVLEELKAELIAKGFGLKTGSTPKTNLLPNEPEKISENRDS